MATQELSEAARKVLKRAAGRERSNICPIVDANVHAATETTLVRSLVRKGLVTMHCGIPRINDAGRAAIASTD